MPWSVVETGTGSCGLARPYAHPRRSDSHRGRRSHSRPVAQRGGRARAGSSARSSARDTDRAGAGCEGAADHDDAEPRSASRSENDSCEPETRAELHTSKPRATADRIVAGLSDRGNTWREAGAEAEAEAEAEPSRAEAEAEAHGLEHHGLRLAKGEADDSRSRDLDRRGRSGIRDPNGLDGPRCAGPAHARSLERRLAGRPRPVGAARSGRMKGKLALLLVPAALFVLALPGSASSAPTAPVPSCSPGPADCSGWHREAVTVYWSHACGPTTISDDTSGTGVSCSAAEGQITITTTVVVAKDGTPPGVRISLDRGPDSNGWYNHAVRAEFTGDDGMSGIASCSPAATYSGPDGEEFPYREAAPTERATRGRVRADPSTMRHRPAST